MTTPCISVCIAHYKGIDMIEACLASVRSQVVGADVEIVVHDDASSDGSAEYLRSAHPDVRLIASTGNVGFCIANNRMAEAARGEYLLLLNNDATLLPDALQTLLDETRRLDRPAILTLSQFDAATGELLDIGSRLDPFLNPVPNRDPACRDVGTVHGACLWIPKRLWQELGGFPEWFGSVGEDLYLCCRARLAGYPVRAPGKSGYRHRVGQSFGGGKAVAGRLVSTYRRRALSERNKNFVMLICHPLPLLLVVLPLHVLLLLLEGSLLSLLRMDRRPLTDIYLPALAGCWHEHVRLRALHCAVQAGRRAGLRDYLSAFTLVPRKLSLLLRHGPPRLD
ncbi:MAG: glycosyltransferase [Rhodocyclaceae bacterium]|jgi:GT2 family glycosyltransferase|nr:glycosyltransferase [Rhodocyclaceae bacterium]